MEFYQIYQMLKPQIFQSELRQANGDPGDSANRDGTMWALIGMIKPGTSHIEDSSFEESMRGHEVSPGRYRRTADPTHWGFNANNAGADQTSPLQLAFAVQGDKKRLSEFAKATVMRFGFFQNIHKGTDCTGANCYKVPDFLRPNNISVHIRGMNYWLAYPLLCLLDLGFLADLYFRKGSADYDNLLFPQLAFANQRLTTPISKLALSLYDRTDALQKLKRNHETGPDRNGISGMYELFELLNERLK